MENNMIPFAIKNSDKYKYVFIDENTSSVKLIVFKDNNYLKITNKMNKEIERLIIDSLMFNINFIESLIK